MKGFKKDGKFRPTGNKKKSSLTKEKLRHKSNNPIKEMKIAYKKHIDDKKKDAKKKDSIEKILEENAKEHDIEPLVIKAIRKQNDVDDDALIENTNEMGDSGTNIEMDDSTEWVLFENYNQMERVAKENVESSIDEGLMNPDFMQGHQTMSETDMRLWGNDAGDMIVEDQDLEELRRLADQHGVKYLDDDDIEEEVRGSFTNLEAEKNYEELVEKEIEVRKEKQEGHLTEEVASAYSNYVEKQIKDNGLRDWVVDDQGLSTDEDFDKDYGKWLHTDVESAVDDAIATDGIGHFLNSYDGDYHELSDNSYLIRTN